MREKDTDPTNRDVPHCPLSEQCLYFMNELKGQEQTDQPALPMMREKGFDRELIEQLHTHLRHCPLCTSALEDAWTARSVQRNELRALLEEEEQQVPSTSEQIKQLIEDEAQQRSEPPAKARPFSSLHPAPGAPQAPERRSLLQSIASLVAVALFLLAASGLFGYLGSLRASFVGRASLTVIPSTGWTSAVMTVTRMNTVSINVLDPISGKSAQLASSPFLAGTSTEGVSHDGTRLLYYVYDGKKTDYYLQPSTKAAILYTFPGKGGHAIWSTGDHFVFVSTAHGVEQVDTQNRVAKLILPGLRYPDLRFYHNGYLYFVNTRESGAAVLERVNASGGAVQEVTNCLRGSSFWLSPTGQTIYYMCRGQRTLFAVNTDGTNAQQLRTDVGTMIGYAADNVPLMLDETNGKYQVVKLGEDKPRDEVLLDDVAPGATLIPAANVAVAPYGHALVTKALYADHHEEIWYGDLESGEKHLLLTPGKNMQVQLGGWSRLRVAATPEVKTTPVQNFSDWHDVLMTGSTAAGWLGLYNVDAVDGSNTLLASKLPSQARVDGVAPDGLHVLYQYADRGKTGYYVLTEAGRSKTFYTLAESEAGNALWMPDSRHVLVATAHNGILMVDSLTGASSALLSTPNGAQITFYRYPYLYFIATERQQAGALYRVNIADRRVQQVTWRSPGSTFWLSPDGYTVYYVNKGSAGQAGIYAADGDSAHQRLISRDGVPIGYADNDDLVIMRARGSKFQAVQLVEASNTTIRERILLDDVVPGAVALCEQQIAPGIAPICDDSIALAPLGKLLFVEARYGDGSRALWSINLSTGKRLRLSSMLAQTLTRLRLVGWDRVNSAI